MNDYDVLIMSCDKNLDVVNILLEQINIHWSNINRKLFVGMEHIDKIDSPIVSKVLTSDSKEWGSRFIETLSKLENDYVFLILDDYIVEETVDYERINEILKFMKENNVANASFSVIRTDKKYENINLYGFEKRYKKGKYLLNLQAGIWNKKVLISLLKPSDTPWTAEYYGSIRAKKISDNYKFISQVPNINGPYIYNNGFLIVQGYINLEEKLRLEQKIGKKLNFITPRNEIKNPMELRKKSIINRLMIKIDLFLKNIEFIFGKDI